MTVARVTVPPTSTSSAKRPLWRQVLDDLEVRLVAGEFDDRFPTDRELVERYDVSRATVREAAGRLQARGVIDRQRGKGSVVSSTEFVQPLGALYSLFQAVEARGIEQASEVLSVGWQVDARAADRLGVDPVTPLFQLTRLRRAGGVPLALDTVWLPADLGGPLMDADFAHTALYDELRARTGVVPDRGEEIVAAVAPDDELRASLELDPDEAVLRVERMGYVGDRHVECRLTLIRGSRFALVSRWPDGGAVTPSIDGEHLRNH
ncbi:MAG: GntR family transcriptional regulator [Nitriliruptoraceae bacterium]|jgi:GntR family transcriptional regulator